MFFHHIPEGQPDAIFGLVNALTADQRPHKIDLLAGVYKNEHLQVELMPSVKQAKEEVAKTLDLSANYLQIDGLQELVEGLGGLLFGKKLWEGAHSRIYGAQTVGGTGALRVGADFLAQGVVKRIYIPEPTWPNHRQIFERANLRVDTYPYYDREKRRFDRNSLEKIEPKAAVLLHACCHNPTGCDPNPEEWADIATFLKERQIVPLFDMAYQGWGIGLEEDAEGLRHCVKEGLECLIAYSCSKNFSLYCQRVGSLFVVNENPAVKLRVASQIKRIIRANYSNPPAHGARIVSHILQGPLLEAWERDLTQMRTRINELRLEFVSRLIAKAKEMNFRPLLANKGMFSFLDLGKVEVRRLIEEFAIYVPENGRINIAGLTPSKMDLVVDSILKVLEK